MALGDVTVTPHSSRVLSVNAEDLGITFENSPILKFQQVETLPPGSDDLLDASHKLLRIGKLPAHDLQQIAQHCALDELSWNLPHFNMPLVEFRDLELLVGHEDGVGSRFQRRPQNDQRAAELVGSSLENFVRATNLLLSPLSNLK